MSAALPLPPASAPTAAAAAGGASPTQPVPATATAFEALILGRGLAPLATAVSATSEAPLSLDAGGDGTLDTSAEETAVDALDGGASLLGLWLQWMRPLPAPVPQDTAPLAGDAPAPGLLLSAPNPTGPAAKVATPPPTPTLALATSLLQTEADTALPLEAISGALAGLAPEPEPAPLPVNTLATSTPLPIALDAAASGASVPVPDLSMLVQPPAVSTAHAPPVTHIQPPINTQQADWTQQLGERIAWSIDEHQDAVIELHPAELGSLSVRVEMRGNDAQVTIVAASAAARDLLQQSLPQLRELLSVQGLNLARAQVERGSSSQNGNQAQSDGGTRERGSGLRSRRQLSSLLLVDAYA